MLPSKYILSDSDRSSTARSHGQQTSLDPYHQQPPPLGITGVICTSRMIDLPNQRGKLHCTIYRPRMLEQSSPPAFVSTNRSSTNSNSPKVHNNSVPKLPKPNPPLICVAGGPGMSCKYLTGLVHLIPDRAIILYDHFNCGQSTNTTTGNGKDTSRCSDTAVLTDTGTLIAEDANLHAIDKEDEQFCSFLTDTVNDLAILIKSIIPINTSFHLYGHSMGGIIVYEYLKNNACSQQNVSHQVDYSAVTNAVVDTTNGGRICKSCIFASTPTNIAASFQSKKELISSIMEELKETGYEKFSKRPSRNGGDDDDDDADNVDVCDDVSDDGDEEQEQQLRHAAHTVFQQRHECRTIPLPLSLQQSLTGLSNTSRYRSKNQNQSKRNLRHTASEMHPTSFNDYVAAPPKSTTPMEIQLPPALILRGQYDFVSEANCRHWEDIYHSCGLGKICQFITVINCSHYGFLEQETLYGNVVLSFLHDHDGKSKTEKRVDNV